LLIRTKTPTEGNPPKAAASRTLPESFYALKHMAAPGIDGVTRNPHKVDLYASMANIRSWSRMR
jgi:hypothetical protein